jgi:GT2 family glycosyltransferase
MALIAMAVYDTEENRRAEYTQKTIECLLRTVDRQKHRIIIVDNGSCEESKKILEYFSVNRGPIHVITLPENIGTAKGINEAWKLRLPLENAVKMDNDVIINFENWVDTMEEAIARDEKIGILGLKRKDLDECPGNPIDWYDSKLYFLPHKPGESWIPFEEVIQLMGTCQMYSAALLKQIGYLTQPGIYGFDDSLASLRSRLTGYKVGFLPAINIDHIDRGDTSYIQQKQRMAAEGMGDFNEMCRKYADGTIPIYYDGN